MSELINVGKSIKRRDARDKLTGKAMYPQDIKMDNMAFGATLRSTIVCGTFTLDYSKVEALDGVLKVLTSKDVMGHNTHGVMFKDHEVLSTSEVKRMGDPLAFVVAETQKLADEAVKLIEVTYVEEQGVFDPREAMKEEARKVHKDTSNIVYHYKCNTGDIEKGFADSAVVIEEEYFSPFVEHVFLQPESGLAYVDEDGKVVVVASSQYPHFDRLEIAEGIGKEVEDVVLLNPIVGGAFGGREDITMQIHLAIATMLTGRTVKTTYSREESFYAHSKRHPVYMTLKTGADKDGKLLALEATLVGDTGAYASWAISVMRKAGVHITGPYEIPNVKVDSYAVYTNNPFAGAMRGFGATQVPIAYECQMDMMAEKLGLNPFEIRRKNMFQMNSMTANGQVLVESVPLEDCLGTIERAMSEKSGVK